MILRTERRSVWCPSLELELTLQDRQSCGLDENLWDALPSPAHPVQQLELPREDRCLAADRLLYADDVVLRLPDQCWGSLAVSPKNPQRLGEKKRKKAVEPLCSNQPVRVISKIRVVCYHSFPPSALWNIFLSPVLSYASLIISCAGQEVIMRIQIKADTQLLTISDVKMENKTSKRQTPEKWLLFFL